MVISVEDAKWLGFIEMFGKHALKNRENQRKKNLNKIKWLH